MYSMLSVGLSGRCNKVAYFGYFKQYQFEIDQWGKLVVRNRFNRRYLKGYKNGSYYLLTDFVQTIWWDGIERNTGSFIKGTFKFSKDELLSYFNKYAIDITQAIAQGIYLPSNNTDYTECVDYDDFEDMLPFIKIVK
jgi:hypothetical protein